MGTLYIVPTPIGNLEDITLRALRVLGEVGVIAAEDTRVTRRLLSRYEIETPMTSFHEHSGGGKLDELIGRLRDTDVALVSDAGTPTINDPGQDLIAEAAASGFDVVALPGASAVTTALAVSGIRAEGFVYLGFLPRRRHDRLRLLRGVAAEPRALIAFEAPHRLARSLDDLLTVLGDQRVAVCREMTKLHEEVFRGTISEAIVHFARPRGEFTLVIEGASGAVQQMSEENVRNLLVRAREDGHSARDAIETVGGLSRMSRRELYRLWLELDVR